MLRRSLLYWCTAAGAGAVGGGKAAPMSEGSAEGAGGRPTATRKFRIESGYTRERAKGYEERGQFFSAFLSLGIVSLGCTFLFIPLYRMYCAPTGRGADPKFYTPEAAKEREEHNQTHPIPKKLLKVRFLSDVGNTMPIAFVPLQKEVEVLVGEPALAFYSAYNRSNRTLLGVSSYTIAPAEVTNYLNKIQCFCFEEQRFKPHELVEMPVFFYIDRDFLDDPMINWLDEVIVNYTFFNLEKTKDIIFRTNPTM